MNKKETQRKEKINLLRSIMSGQKPISELSGEKVFWVSEETPGNFTDEKGRVWRMDEMDSHKFKNPTHIFFCLYSCLHDGFFGYDHKFFYSKTGNLKW
jgi:hypothetical protein